MRTSEGNKYLDTGCSLHPSCLECPLPMCAEDLDPLNKQTLKPKVKDLRNMRIMSLVANGRSVREIAIQLKISPRTVKGVKMTREEGR